jgi:hypothetical protein
MAMTLEELHAQIGKSKSIARLASDVSKELFNISASPIHARIKGYTELLNEVEKLVSATDLTSKSTVENGDEYFSIRMALFSAETNGIVHPGRFALMLTNFMVGDRQPSIDDYVDAMRDTTLMDKLGLRYDKEYLVKIEKGMELRNRAVIIGETMLYPHQFLRRFYSASFVGIPPLLSRCIKQGMSVKLRLDPLRISQPENYRDWMEFDYWHGRHFSPALLEDNDKAPLWTVHLTTDFMPSKEKPLSPDYPVSFTIFRSKMMDDNLREFMVEEFTPTVNPLISSERIRGIDKIHTIQKFAHLVYDQNNKVFSHLDGAVRVFKNKEYEAAFSALSTGADPGEKIGTRHKLFLVEGKLGIDMVQDLLYDFFMYNPHIEEYFATDTVALAT